MLKNERYHLQLCIYNDEWRKTEVKVEVKGSLSKYCQLRVVDNVPAETTNYSSSDDYYIFDRGESRLYPDILRPFEYGDVMIPSKQWKSVWCTIHCPSGLPTGKHTLIFAVDVPEKDTMTAELNVEVMDVSLPESDLFYTNWFHYDGIANYLNCWKALLGAKRFWNFCITKVFAVGKNIREMRNGILCSVKN